MLLNQFDTKSLSLEQGINLLNSAKNKCFNWWFDVLKSVCREKVEISYEEAIKIATDIYLKNNKDLRFTVFYRENRWGLEESHIEFGFSTFSTPSYFLWILVNIDDGLQIINDFNLKRLEI